MTLKDRELLAVVRLIDLIKELEIKMLTSEEKAAEIWLLIKRIYLQPIISEMKNGRRILELTSKSKPH